MPTGISALSRGFFGMAISSFSRGFLAFNDEDAPPPSETTFNNVHEVPGSYTYFGEDLLLDLAGNDVTSSGPDNQVSVTGYDLFMLRNTTGAPLDFLLTSVANRNGRFSTPPVLSLSIPAGDTRIVGPLELEGWMNALGKVTFRASASGLRLAVIRLPQNRARN